MEQVNLITKNKIKEREKETNNHSYDPSKFENYFSKLVRKMEEEKTKKKQDKEKIKERYMKAKVR